MSNTIRIKRRLAGDGPGAPSTLANAELAFNEDDSILFYGEDIDAYGNAVNIIPIAGSGAFVDLTSAQTINGVKTFVSSPIVPSPTAAGEAANKGYVDSVAQGLDIKESVRAATTEEIVLNGIQTIDGVVLQAGDRVLVKDQYDPIENGIYVVSSGSWVRSDDLNEYTGNASGSFVFVEGGSVHADSGWVISSLNDPTPGEDAIIWVQFSGAGSIIAGTGLEKTGNTISLDGQALALHNLASNGIFVRTGLGTVEARSVVAAPNAAITVTNGNGVVGNIELDLANILNEIGGLTPQADSLIGFGNYGEAILFSLGTLGSQLIVLDDDVYGTENARNLLGLGTISVQDADAVDISGGTLTDVLIQYATIENSIIDGGDF